MCSVGCISTSLLFKITKTNIFYSRIFNVCDLNSGWIHNINWVIWTKDSNFISRRSKGYERTTDVNNTRTSVYPLK